MKRASVAKPRAPPKSKKAKYANAYKVAFEADFPTREGNSGNGDSVKNGNAQTLPRDPEDTSVGDTGTGDMLRGTVSVEFETKEGSARFDKDLKFCKGLLEFKDTESIKTISIPIINDNQYEADVDFYVTLKNARGLDASVGDPNIARVTIIDDDEPGEFQFDQSSYYADPRAGSVALTVIREKGCDGNVSVEYGTIDGSAKGGPGLDSGVDYEEVHGVLQFQHCEAKKQVMLKMNKDSLGSKNLLVTLRNPSIGAKIGKNSAVMVTITSDPLAERLANVMGDEEEITWSGQFKSAMVLEPEQDEDGNDLPLSGLDYVLHFISFFWKVIFAFIPPRTYLGAWPTFITSLLGIGMLTGLVEQLANLLSCVIGLKASVAGITIVALGTSLPDTFASRTAALHDQYADASIGNITGSNSVNVFLGLGLPWVIKAMYKLAKNKTYTVSTNNLGQSVLVFVIVGTICLIILVLRRRFVGGELGGKNKFVKVLSASFMIFLWVIYITLSSIKAYNPDVLPW
ncbi:Sodium/calcium exchanger 3 [Lamellibrachia satsuma]|nr:Sodium/calcium exchanger 3 [Lamellibrachia satsuma]